MMHIFYYSLKSCPVEELNLSLNGLCRLPDWIGDMKSIRKLNISNTKTTELPERYVYWFMLSKFWLSSYLSHRLVIGHSAKLFSLISSWPNTWHIWKRQLSKVLFTSGYKWGLELTEDSCVLYESLPSTSGALKILLSAVIVGCWKIVLPISCIFFLRFACFST